MVRIKDLKKWCETKDDDDVVFLCEYSHNSETYDRPTSGWLWVRPPQKIDFKHEECKHYELVDVKGELRKFCNRKNEFFNEYYSYNACRKFESDKEINYCRECAECKKTYRSCPYVKDYEQIRVDNGYVRRY
ncbi:MAG: hypothetical protein IJ258_05085 [Methanobrevibacter sp.]|uniref:hypothetical protein n=1 Tax=Methanobrevibacter sp. TaxID=66852 RepID=UPI0025E14C89|nr:hypothetical protein [Methanobrevibacter sp.]MBQ8017463.1 hypothetical protein [Methanobrevibacter sp.]